MDRAQEAALFARLISERRLKEWLADQLAGQVKILLVNQDVEALRKAQGSAQFIQAFLDRLTAAETAARQ
jgi:hypothetical protein